MSKSRKLSRPEIESLGKMFGCLIASRSVGSNTGGLSYDIYIVFKDKREKVGNIPTNNPIYIPWTDHQWTEAFQRISGISGADLWNQGKRGGR